jgi:hypothetical protein
VLGTFSFTHPCYKGENVILGGLSFWRRAARKSMAVVAQLMFSDKEGGSIHSFARALFLSFFTNIVFLLANSPYGFQLRPIIYSTVALRAPFWMCAHPLPLLLCAIFLTKYTHTDTKQVQNSQTPEYIRKMACFLQIGRR